MVKVVTFSWRISWHGNNDLGDIPEYDWENYFADEYGNPGFNDWWDSQSSEDAWWNSQSTIPDPATGDDGWTDEPTDPDGELDEAYLHLMKEQDEAERAFQEVKAVMAENERNLADARKAVAAAARDRGWQHGPQQRQAKFTSTYKSGGKDKGKFKPKGQLNYQEDVSWMKGKGFKGPGKGFNPSKSGSFKGYQQSKGKGINYMAHNMFPMTMDYTYNMESNPKENMSEHESIIDTGATASAGGQAAVESLCAAVMNARPTAEMEVYRAESDQPWFRFGNGKWGRSLYRVVLACHGITMSIFALPSVGVPVLIGMSELKKLNAILNCSNGRSIINGRMTTLRMTSKRHRSSIS